jgi:hypothetical protein
MVFHQKLRLSLHLSSSPYSILIKLLMLARSLHILLVLIRKGGIWVPNVPMGKTMLNLLIHPKTHSNMFIDGNE